MKKIDLKICMGTMFYVMVGAELKDAIDSLPQHIKEHLNISYSPCLGCCTERQEPPFIELNGQIIAGVSKVNLIQIVKEEVRDVV